MLMILKTLFIFCPPYNVPIRKRNPDYPVFDYLCALNRIVVTNNRISLLTSHKFSQPTSNWCSQVPNLKNPQRPASMMGY